MKASFVFILLLALCFSATAQIRTVSGAVTDQYGASVAGAAVTFRSGDNIVFETWTDADGKFLAKVEQRVVSIEIHSFHCFSTWSKNNYDLGSGLNVNLGSMVLIWNKDCPIPEDMLPPPQPVETAKTDVFSELSLRPLLPIPANVPINKRTNPGSKKSPQIRP